MLGDLHPEPSELVGGARRDQRAVVALHLELRRIRRRQLAEDHRAGRGRLDLDVELQAGRAERELARRSFSRPGERVRLEPGVGEQLGELGVDAPPAKCRLRVRGHLVGHGVDRAREPAELEQQVVVLAHQTPISAISVMVRSFSRHRMRVGPIEPTGMPSAAPTSS